VASVDGPSFGRSRHHVFAFEKSRDEATNARRLFGVGHRVADHGHAKGRLQAGAVGRKRGILRRHGFVVP